MNWVHLAIGVAIFVAFFSGLFRLKWAVFVSASKRPPILNQKHTDWPIHVPRSWFALLGRPPVAIFGRPNFDPETGVPKPVPAPGHWWFGWPLYFAITARGWHFRIGLRWDDVDGYYQISIALHRVK